MVDDFESCATIIIFLPSTAITGQNGSHSLKSTFCSFEDSVYAQDDGVENDDKIEDGVVVGRKDGDGDEVADLFFDLSTTNTMAKIMTKRQMKVRSYFVYLCFNHGHSRSRCVAITTSPSATSIASGTNGAESLFGSG